MIPSVNQRSRKEAISTLLFLVLCAAAPGQSNGLSEAGEQAVPEVRFLCLAPSPYTQRHDALRDGLGIMVSLQRLIKEHGLSLRVTFYDGIPALESRARAGALLRGAQVLLVGSSIWAQGSSYYLRSGYTEHGETSDRDLRQPEIKRVCDTRIQSDGLGIEVAVLRGKGLVEPVPTQPSLVYLAGIYHFERRTATPGAPASG